MQYGGACNVAIIPVAAREPLALSNYPFGSLQAGVLSSPTSALGFLGSLTTGTIKSKSLPDSSALPSAGPAPPLTSFSPSCKPPLPLSPTWLLPSAPCFPLPSPATLASISEPSKLKTASIPAVHLPSNPFVQLPPTPKALSLAHSHCSLDLMAEVHSWPLLPLPFLSSESPFVVS